MHDPCPVTSGAATRMTRESFARTCAGKRSARRATGMWLEGGDWRFKRCATCKGRPENWPPELTIITMEATMTAKKQPKPASTTTETELLAKLQLELRSREETLKRLAEMLGCMPGDLERGMATMQTLVQEIRDVVEPEVADAHPATLPDACRELARRCRESSAEAEQLQARLAEANARLGELAAEQAAETPEPARLLDVGADVYRSALADFGLAVLSGNVQLTFRGEAR